MKTSSIAVETSRSISQSDSIVRQTNKRSFLSDTTMNNIHIFNDIEQKYGRTALRLIRRHERCSRKLARFSNHLTFLTRCIKTHIIPRDLRVQPPVPTKGARRVAELASKRFLRERIRLTQRAKGDAKRETESTAEGITATLKANEASDILEKIRVNTQRVFNATKDRQQRKFLKLVQEKQASVSPRVKLTSQVDKSKWVINLSSRPLNDAEVSLLEKGLNFAVTPTTIPATEIVAKVETAIRTLDSEQADTIRRTVNSVLQKAEPVQWINLRTKGRSRYGEPCLRGYSQHLHGRF